MSRFWILVADGSQAYIYSAKRVGGPIKRLKSFKNPAGREKNIDLVSDRPSSGGNKKINGIGTVPTSSDPKKIEKEKFASKISLFLEFHALNDSFDQLVLVAPPQFLGLLRSCKRPHWEEKATLRIQKDYVTVPKHKLPSFLYKEAA